MNTRFINCRGKKKKKKKKKKKNQPPNVHGQHQIVCKKWKEKKKKRKLIQAVRIYSQTIGMEFGIEKCTMLIIKSGKWQMTKGAELPNQEKIRTHGEKETDKYLGILEADTIKRRDERKN